MAPKLVRGLDYYSQTVFEIEADIDGFGAQNVLGGGGRYEELVSELGGPKTGAIGVAFGMERLLLALEAENINLAKDNTLDIYMILFNQKDITYGLSLAHKLRLEGLSVEINFTNKSFKAQLKQALNYEAKFLLIMGDDEINSEVVTVKDTRTQEQEQIPIRILARRLKEILYG